MNTLIDVYGKLGYVNEAGGVFESLQTRDIVSWGALIASYVQHGLDHTGLAYFERMQFEGLSPNEVVYVSALKACTAVGTPLQSMILHHQIVKAGLGLDVTIGTTLINMYGKLGYIQEACKLFHTMGDTNEVTWGSMVAGYVQNGFCLPALKTFIRMQNEGLNPEKACFLLIFKACGKMGTVESRLMHAQIVEIGLTMDAELGSALVHMYVNCESLSDAYTVVSGLQNGNIVSWGAMIAGFARSGLYEKAGECVESMNGLGLKPDNAIFINLLCACSNAGLLEQGCEVFSSMRESYGVEPVMDHYNCLTDLLGRAGLMEKAEDILLCMPTPSDVYGWISLLSCCRIHRNLDLAGRCLVQVIH
jgi:pentatricopeptide repeat protein